jgi:hypothetical protein
MVKNKINFWWIWDNSFDVEDKYNPENDFDEFRQSVKQRRQLKIRRRTIYYSAAIIFFVAFLTLFVSINKSGNYNFLHNAQAVNKTDFILKIEGKTYVNMFINSNLLINKENIIIKQDTGSVIIPLTGKNEIFIHVPVGMRYSVSLKDGSKIWLTSNSTISIPAGFAKNERKIKAGGHLYFEIEKSDNPFIIDFKENTSVVVYGTVFNVESYLDSSTMRICLNEGKVSLKTGDNENILLPNQSLFYDIEKKVISIKEMNNSENIFWKNGRLYFNDVSLENLAGALSKWFDVSVSIHEEDVKKMTFTGNIPDNLSLEEITEIINAAGIFKSEYKERIVHFYKN